LVGFAVQAPVVVDVRLLIVIALVVLAVCLAFAFARIALAIHRDHEARFRRIRRQLEENATFLLAALLRTE